MGPSSGATDFYATVPVFSGFDRITEAGLYVPLPDDWILGLADVTGSAAAIAAGRYKAVNMAGAPGIARGAHEQSARPVFRSFSGGPAPASLWRRHATDPRRGGQPAA